MTLLITAGSQSKSKIHRLCRIITYAVHRFQDKLSINISDSQFLTVSLLAHGSGTTIVSTPAMAPAIRLGPQFSCQPVARMFQLTNRGRRSQQIYWSTEGFPSFKTRRKPDYNPDDMKYQVTEQDFTRLKTSV